ncbi:MAG TPA: O-antigen ligase family protein [Devosia sp.]|nr:O-antigen ligase family protein [Devosia sp.]
MIRSAGTQVAFFLTALFLGATLVLPFNGGYVLAYALMALTLIITLALLVARGRWMIGAAGWCFIGAFALVAIAFSLNGDGAMAFNFVFLLAFIPLSSWLARHAGPDSAAIVAWLALVGTVVSAITALREIWWLGNSRAEGWWSDPIWAAEAALILGFLSLVAFPVMRSRWRLLLLLGPVLGLGVVALSGSRGPLLAAPVIALALVLTSFRPWWKQIAALGAVAVLAGALVLPFAPRVLDRIERTGTVIVQLVTTGTIKEKSAGARLAFWQAGAAAFRDSPWIGYGWSKRVRSAYEYLPDKGAKFDAKGSGLRGNHHLHADLLDMGVAGGVLGLGAYGLILLAPLLGAFRSARDGQRPARIAGAVILSVGYAACGITYLMFGYEFHTTLYVCLTAIVLGFVRDAPPAASVSRGA